MNKIDVNKTNVSGLILAGGEGSRLGGQDKGLVEYQGEKLIHRQINWLAPSVGELMISANRNLDFYQSLGYSVLRDPTQNYDGPLQGILLALRVCKTPWLMVNPVDVPCLPNDTVTKLYECVVNNDVALYLKTSERAHYLSLLINKNLIEPLQKFVSEGKRRARTFLEENGARGIDLGISENQFKNLNEYKNF